MKLDTQKTSQPFVTSGSISQSQPFHSTKHGEPLNWLPVVEIEIGGREPVDDQTCQTAENLERKKSR